jgi:hypothetical protein
MYFLKISAFGIFGCLLLAALLSNCEDAERCSQRGGVYVRKMIGGYECVSPR